MWNSPSKEYTLMPDGRRVCVASEWKLRSNPSSAAVSMTGSPKPSSMASPKPSSTSSPKMYSPPMPSPMQAPNRAPLPPSLEEATLKLEAGQRNALEEELEEWAAAAEEKEEEEEEEEAAAAAEEKLDAAATATPQKLLEAAPQEPVEVCQASKVVDLQAWQAKGIAKNRVVDCHQMAAVGEFIILLLWLYLWSTSSGAGRHSSHQLCSWNWRLFHCSTGCKIRMHLPGLQNSCTLYNVEELA